MLPAKAVIALQPRPIATQASWLTIDGVTVTAISRLWAPDDAARCRLCQTCKADAHGMCLVQVSERIPRSECPLFSIVDYLSRPGLG
jgi:hypothetical protein